MRNTAYFRRFLHTLEVVEFDLSGREVVGFPRSGMWYVAYFPLLFFRNLVFSHCFFLSLVLIFVDFYDKIRDKKRRNVL